MLYSILMVLISYKYMNLVVGLSDCMIPTSLGYLGLVFTHTSFPELGLDMKYSIFDCS